MAISGQSINSKMLDRQAGGVVGLENFNFSNTRKTRLALMKSRTGTFQTRGIFIGDSTTSGRGAGTGASNTDGARQLSPLAQVRDILVPRTDLIVRHASIWGTANYTAAYNHSAEMTFSAGSGWGASIVSIGADMWGNSTTTAALAIKPGFSWTNVRIGYHQFSGGGVFSTAISDGGTSLTGGTVNTTGSQAFVQATRTKTAGDDTLYINRSTLEVRIIFVEFWNSSEGALLLHTAGWGGSTTTGWNSTTNVISAGAAIQGLTDFQFGMVNLGTNDRQGAAVALDLFTTQYGSIITKVAASGMEPIVVIPFASNDTAIGERNAYNNAMRNVAYAGNYPIIDFSAVLADGTVDAAYHIDTNHLLVEGNATLGRLLVAALERMGV